MTRPRANRVTTALVAVVVVVSVALTGCTTTEDDPTMNFDEARTELDTILLAVQNLIGGERRIKDGGAEDCSLPSGNTGAWAPLSRQREGVPLDQQQEIIAEVSRIFTDAGFEPTITEQPPIDGIPITEIAYPAAGYGEDGLYIAFTIAETVASIQSQTRCVPGDAGQINQDYQDNLEQEQAEQNSGG